MTERNPPPKSLMEQILDETFSEIETLSLFNTAEIVELKKLAAERRLNKEAIATILSADSYEEFDENSGA
jgi:hypothetical protein